MLEIQIPGQNLLNLEYLLCDINGTLSIDGKLIEGVKEAVAAAKPMLDIQLVTADTMGTASDLAAILGVKLHRVFEGNEARQKENLLFSLGPEKTVAFGQGANDVLMLKKAALGICVLSKEGTYLQAIQGADIVVPDILSAFDLLLKPTRLIATLRQ